jgi:hypothetical protein
MIDKMGQVIEYSFNRCLWLHKDLCNFSHEAIMPSPPALFSFELV